MYHAIQSYQDTSGVHWDTPDNKQDIGGGAKITTDAEAQGWQVMIDSKVCYYYIVIHCSKSWLFSQKNHPMKLFTTGAGDGFNIWRRSYL